MWEGISTAAKDFIHTLLQVDQNKRPNAAEALQLPWIKSMSQIKIDEKVASSVLANLRHFHKTSLIKTAALNFIGSQLVHKKDKQEIIKVFKSMDKEGHGFLTKKEVKDGFEQLCQAKISDSEVNELFSAVDMNGTGKIEYTEFIVACMDRQHMLSEENLSLSFKMLDKDGSGVITTKDIKNVFGEFNLHDRVVQDLMKQADKNGDGKITKDQYLKLMKHASTGSQDRDS